MSNLIRRFGALALAASMLMAFAGCGREIPVATEEEGMRGMQDMDSGAETAPR